MAEGFWRPPCSFWDWLLLIHLSDSLSGRGLHWACPEHQRGWAKSSIFLAIEGVRRDSDFTFAFFRAPFIMSQIFSPKHPPHQKLECLRGVLCARLSPSDFTAHAQNYFSDVHVQTGFNVKKGRFDFLGPFLVPKAKFSFLVIGEGVIYNGFKFQIIWTPPSKVSSKTTPFLLESSRFYSALLILG